MRDVFRWICAAVVLALLLGRGLALTWPVMLSSLLAAGVLALGLAWSEVNWKQGFFAVFVFEFVVGRVNTLDEAVFFHVLPAGQLATLLAGGAFVSLVLAAVLTFAPPLRGPSASGIQTPSKLWVRVPLLAFIYVLIYFTAGMLVRPYTISFYQPRPLPGFAELVVVEVLRGFLYLAAAWPWLRLLKGRLRAASFLGAAYSILGGISPLLLPNPLMPGHIRLAHGFEIGISNFVFGALVGWALTTNPPPLTNRLTEAVRT